MGNCSTTTENQEQDLDLINYPEEIRHFYVICIMYNPARSRSRIKLYLNFKRQMEQYGVKLITLECTYDNAPFALTRENYEPQNIQVTTNGAFFQKEALINLAISKLPLDAKYAAYCDCEVSFENPTWVNDTIKALHVFKIVQPFDNTVLLNIKNEEIKKVKGFSAHLYENKEMDKEAFEESTVSCGFAWAFRVGTLKEIGGLIDYCPLGNCDKIMAYCLAKRIDDYIPEGLTHNFKDMLRNWQKKSTVAFSAGVGFIPGTIRVAWSTARKDKKNFDKWEILEKNHYDPKTDLLRENNQLYGLDQQKIGLRDELRNHFEYLNGEMLE